jgi:hypothetical protein
MHPRSPSQGQQAIDIPPEDEILSAPGVGVGSHRSLSGLRRGRRSTRQLGEEPRRLALTHHEEHAVSNEDRIIDNIIRRERAPAGQPEFTNRASDRGGPTKFGVTQRAWDDYRARSPNYHRAISRVEGIDENDAREFYRVMYVRPLAWIDDFDLLDLVADCAVNHGATRAVRWLQSALGVAPDGIVGPDTRIAARGWLGAREIAADVLRTRLKFYAKIATDQTNDPDAVNLPGWINRACEFIR